MSPVRDHYDLVVVGAGPAGMAAAATAARAGLGTLLLDESPGPGGQVWRGLGQVSAPVRKVLDYGRGELLAAELRGSGAEIVAGATVWSLDRSLEIGVSIAGGSRLLRARRVVIATGSLERPFPIPGWTLPGVMSAGAAQTLLKTGGLVPSGRTILAGQGPLLWLLGGQILRLGGRIDAVLDTSDRGRLLQALPHAWAFGNSGYLLEGLRMMREVRRRVPVVRGVTALAAEGEGQLEGVRFTARGRSAAVGADLLLLHQGVVPNSNLAMAAGLRHRWDEAQLCWQPVLGPGGETSVAGIAIAGDGAGIAGVDAAVLRGRLAGMEAIKALSPALARSPRRARAALAAAERGRAFLDAYFRPAPQFRMPEDDVIVCRCEEITAGQVRDAVAMGAAGPNQLKAYLRAGMGPCQGRLCGLTVTELIAEARGKSPAAIGHYRVRAPVKPITVAELASLPQPEDAVTAVVR